jgi:hypothetical protein
MNDYRNWELLKSTNPVAICVVSVLIPGVAIVLPLMWLL